MYDGEVLASNPAMHELMLDVIRQTLAAVPVRT
jgi:hypothetical protein